MLKNGIQKVFALLITVLIIANLTAGCKKDEGGKKTTAPKVSGIQSTTKKSAGATTKKTTTGSTTSGEENEDEGTEQTGEDSEGEEDETGEEDEDSDIVEEIPDLGGRVINVLFGAEVQVPVPDEADLSKTMLYESFRHVEQKYNCKFEAHISQPSGWPNITAFYLQDLLAGLNTYDILMMHTRAEMLRLISKGYLLQLDDYVNENNYVFNEYREVTTWQGKLWGLVSGDFSEIEVPNYITFYKKEMIDGEGLRDIYEIAREGEWTWGVFLDYAIQTTKDLNGDGIIDQWGIYAQPYVFFDAMMLSNGVQFVVASYEDGSLECGFDSPQAITTMQQIAEFNLIHKVTVGGNFQDGPFQKGTAAMTVGPPLWYPQFFAGRGMGPLGIAPVPKGPNVDIYTNVRTDNRFNCFPYYLEDPKNVISAYLDVLDKTEQYESRGITPEEVNYAWCVLASDSPENANILLNFSKIFNIAPITSQPYRGLANFQALVTQKLVTPVMNGKLPVISAVDETLPVIQAVIDDINK